MADGVTFTPLDGAAKTNTVVAPGPITHAEAVLLVYHSDDTAPRSGARSASA